MSNVGTARHDDTRLPLVGVALPVRPGRYRAGARWPPGGESTRRSSRCRSAALFPAASPGTTSPSTTRLALSSARQPVLCRSSQRARQFLAIAAGAARCGAGARRRASAESSASEPTRKNGWGPARPGGRVSSPGSTGNGGPWWNGPSPGWSPLTIAVCATEAWSAISSGSPCAWPLSTSRRLINLGLS